MFGQRGNCRGSRWGSPSGLVHRTVGIPTGEGIYRALGSRGTAGPLARASPENCLLCLLFFVQVSPDANASGEQQLCARPHAVCLSVEKKGSWVPWASKKACKTNNKSLFLCLAPTWPFGLHLVPIRSPSGGLGASWGRLGDVLGPSWAVLGASWVRLGGVLTSLGFPKKLIKPLKNQPFCCWPPGGGPKNFIKPMKNQHFCFWSPLDSIWSHLVPLRWSWGVLEASWGRLEASWDVLGASWGDLGRLGCVLGCLWGSWGPWVQKS